MNILKMFSTGLVIATVLGSNITAFAIPPRKYCRQYENVIDPEKFCKEGENRFILMSFVGEKEPVKVYLQSSVCDAGYEEEEDEYFVEYDEKDSLNHTLVDFALTFFKIKGLEEVDVEIGTSYDSENKYNYFHNGKYIADYHYDIRELDIHYGDLVTVAPSDKVLSIDCEKDSCKARRKALNERMGKLIKLSLFVEDKKTEKFIKNNEISLNGYELASSIRNEPLRISTNTTVVSPSNDQPNAEPLPALWQEDL